MRPSGDQQRSSTPQAQPLKSFYEMRSVPKIRRVRLASMNQPDQLEGNWSAVGARGKTAKDRGLPRSEAPATRAPPFRTSISLGIPSYLARLLDIPAGVLKVVASQNNSNITCMQGVIYLFVDSGSQAQMTQKLRMRQMQVCISVGASDARHR